MEVASITSFMSSSHEVFAASPAASCL